MKLPKPKALTFGDLMRRLRLPFVSYFWVFGFTKSGKKVLLGPYTTELEANERAQDLDDYEVFELKTRDEQKATRQIKEILLERGTPIDEAIERHLHEKGLSRELRRGGRR